MYPTTLKYTKDHEWVKLDEAEAAVGITNFAQGQLGDVVFVELPEVGRRVKQGDIFGTIESVKAVSELFAPISGEIVAINTNLGVHPEQINTTPHDAWMIKIKPSALAETEGLLDADAYTTLVK